MVAGQGEVALLAFRHHLGEVVDQHVVEAEGQDGHCHVVPLHLPPEPEHARHQQSVGHQEGTHPAVVPRSLRLPPQPEEGVRSHELDEGGREEDGGAEEEGLVELLVGLVVVGLQPLHDPHRKVASIHEERETHQTVGPVGAAAPLPGGGLLGGEVRQVHLQVLVVGDRPVGGVPVAEEVEEGDGERHEGGEGAEGLEDEFAALGEGGVPRGRWGRGWWRGRRRGSRRPSS